MVASVKEIMEMGATCVGLQKGNTRDPCVSGNIPRLDYVSVNIRVVMGCCKLQDTTTEENWTKSIDDL